MRGRCQSSNYEFIASRGHKATLANKARIHSTSDNGSGRSTSNYRQLECHCLNMCLMAGCARVCGVSGVCVWAGCAKLGVETECEVIFNAYLCCLGQKCLPVLGQCKCTSDYYFHQQSRRWKNNDKQLRLRQRIGVFFVKL